MFDLFQNYRYLILKWKECINSNVALPHPCISVYDKDGNFAEKIHNDILLPTREDQLVSNVNDDQTLLESAVIRLSENNEELSNAEEGQQVTEQEEIMEFQLLDTDHLQAPEDTNIHVDCAAVVVKVDIALPNCQTLSQKRSLPLTEEKTPVVTKKSRSETQSNQEEQSTLPTCSTSIKTTSHITISTALGKNVSKVLGETELVFKFERLRQQWKSMPKNREIHEQYLDVLAEVETKVSSTHSELRSELKRWEKAYINRNHVAPLFKNIQEHQEVLKEYKRYHLSKDFLSHWKIKTKGQ